MGACAIVSSRFLVPHAGEEPWCGLLLARMILQSNGCGYAVRGGLFPFLIFELAEKNRVWSGVSAYDLDPKLIDRYRRKAGLVYVRK